MSLTTFQRELLVEASRDLIAINDDEIRGCEHLIEKHEKAIVDHENAIAASRESIAKLRLDIEKFRKENNDADKTIKQYS